MRNFNLIYERYLPTLRRCLNASWGRFLQNLEEATKLGSKLLNNEVYYSYIQTFTCSLKDSTGWLAKRKRVRQWNALILARYTKYSHGTMFNTRNHVTDDDIGNTGSFSTWETNIQGRKIYCLYIYKRRYERDASFLISSFSFCPFRLHPLLCFSFFFLHSYLRLIKI